MQGKVEICGVNTARLTVLSPVEMDTLLRLARQGDSHARQKLIEGNLRLVLSVIQRFDKRGENPDDLFQVGCIGLMKAIANFDPDKQVRFSTYGVPMIAGEVRRYLRDNSAIRVSRSIRDVAYRVLQCKDAMTARMDRALFSATDSILVACHAQFQEAISRAKPFIENIGGTEQTTVEHGVWDFWRSGYQYFIAPCFGGYLPDEVLRMYQTPTLAPLMEKYVSHMRKENRYVSFCTREGLLDFARTGILPEYSDQIVPVVAPKARALILKEMLYHPNPSKPIYLLDDSRVQASSEFIFFVAPKERIILQRRQMKGMKVYVFQENNLIHAFSDYFAYLEQSDLILPTRDLNDVLLAGIQIAEALEAEEKKS